MTNAGIFVGAHPISRASNFHGAIDLVMSAKRRTAVHSRESVHAGAYIWGNAAPTICTRVDAFASHDRPLDPDAGIVRISNVIGMVDTNVSSGLNGKATIIDRCPVVIIVVALLPFPPIAEEAIRCYRRLPVAIAILGP